MRTRKSTPTSIPMPSRSVITVAGLIPGQRATFEGRVSEVEDTTKGRRTRSVDRRRRQQRRDHRHLQRPGAGAPTSSPVSCCGSPAKPVRAETGPRRWSTRRTTSWRTPRRPASSRATVEKTRGNEATGSGVGVGVGLGVHRERLPAADQAWLRLGVRVRLRGVRVGASGAGARRPVGGAGGGVAPAARATTPIQLAGVGDVRAGTAGPAPCWSARPTSR